MDPVPWRITDAAFRSACTQRQFAARIVYTTLHAGGKFDDSAYKTSGGLHGVGSSVVNALSTYMDVGISRDGYIHHDRYERGITGGGTGEWAASEDWKNEKRYESQLSAGSWRFLKRRDSKRTEVKSRMHETAYLNPALTIIYEDQRGQEVEHIVYHEEEGIIGFVKDLNKNKEALHDPFILKGESGRHYRGMLHSSIRMNFRRIC